MPDALAELTPGIDLAPYDWVRRASQLLRDEEAAVAATPLIELDLGDAVQARIIIKNEALLPTGSLKHRVARALFQYGVANGDITPRVHIVEASSGCAAISEAYFAKLLGLRFTAVVPASTALPKIDEIRGHGGNVVFAKPGEDLWSAAAQFAAQPGHYFLDQFKGAERASCWRGTKSLSAELFGQLEERGTGLPDWIVVGAGTGGTSSSIGRYLRHHGHWGEVKLCVVDPIGSIFFRQFTNSACEPGGSNSDFIEGIGRKRLSPSFIPALVDRMIEVPDTASIAAAHWLRSSAGLDFGPSTGTNLVGAMLLATACRNHHQKRPTIVILGCDPGHRYEATIFDKQFLGQRNIDPRPWVDRIEAFLRSGSLEGGSIRQVPGQVSTGF